MNLVKLTTCQLERIFSVKYAKYLSQHNVDRHYIINYNIDKTFTTSLYVKNVLQGKSYGTYNLNDDRINIKYLSVFPSPYIESPFHPLNPFHNNLKDYYISNIFTYPDYDIHDTIPLFYSHLTIGNKIKVLTLYNK